MRMSGESRKESPRELGKELRHWYGAAAEKWSKALFRDCDSPTPLPQHGVNLAAYGVAPAFLPAPVLDCSSNEYGNGGGFIPPVRGRTLSHGWLSAHVRERACPPQTHRTWYRSPLAPLPPPLPPNTATTCYTARSSRLTACVCLARHAPPRVIRSPVDLQHS